MIIGCVRSVVKSEVIVNKAVIMHDYIEYIAMMIITDTYSDNVRETEEKFRNG